MRGFPFFVVPLTVFPLNSNDQAIGSVELGELSAGHEGMLEIISWAWLQAQEPGARFALVNTSWIVQSDFG